LGGLLREFIGIGSANYVQRGGRLDLFEGGKEERGCLSKGGHHVFILVLVLFLSWHHRAPKKRDFNVSGNHMKIGVTIDCSKNRHNNIIDSIFVKIKEFSLIKLTLSLLIKWTIYFSIQKPSTNNPHKQPRFQ